MFWNKTVSGFFIACTAILSNGCSDNPVTLQENSLDTAKINNWSKVYDSLYEIHFQTKDIRFLELAGAAADSVLSYEDLLLIDSVHRKLFIGILFGRSIDLNTLRHFIRSRNLLEKYINTLNEYRIIKPEYLAYAQVTLGNIYSRYGDYKKAALLLDQGIKYYAAVKDTESIASCILNMSIPLKELQRYDESIRTLNKIFGLKSILPKRKTIACIELADIYLQQQNYKEAERQIQKANELIALITNADTDPKDRTGIYSTLYKVEGDWLTANEKPLQALSVYRQSIDSAKIASGDNIRNRDIGKTFIAMGKALEQMHLYDSALHYYNRALYCVANIDTLNKFALPGQKDIYAENTIAEALYARANCIINSKKENETELENAVNSFKLAFETESKLLEGFSYDDSRMYMLEQTRKQIEKAITLCYRLYQKTTNSHWANEAFLFAEHNKAFVLAESVRRNTAASQFLQNDSLYEKIQGLRKNLAWLEIETGKQQFSGIKDTALTQSLIKTKQKTEEELLAAENSIRLKNPQYSRQVTDRIDLTADELLDKTLTTDSRLVEYFTGDSAAYVFSGEKNKPVGFFRLPAAVEKISSDFQHFFSDRNHILLDPAGYAAAANRLYSSILGPYISKKNSVLLIIPDGFISYIPFDALLTDSTASTNIASFPFLIRQQETYYAFSCKTLLEQEKYKNTVVQNSVAVFAPVFANKERGLAPLLHSNEELEAIKKIYPDGKFYAGKNATLNQFDKNYSTAGIIHLATHAGLDNRSGIAGIEFYDSTLYLNSIYTMPLKAKLVVLSGCETGTGSVNKTEGLMSLARGFSYAGTKNVIGSLWQTADNTSAEIFKNFYSNLSDNNFSSALHKAKLAVIDHASVTSASPYYWSGYIYIGSAEENIKQQNNKQLKLILLLGGLASITILYFLLRRRSTKINQAVF